MIIFVGSTHVSSASRGRVVVISLANNALLARGICSIHSQPGVQSQHHWNGPLVYQRGLSERFKVKRQNIYI
jgi:hypothetical protein